MTRQYYVYITTNRYHTVLYTGVTNDLVRRIWQHRQGQGGEVYHDSYNAIAREKQVKAGSRQSKIKLVQRMNPEWQDLYDQL